MKTNYVLTRIIIVVLICLIGWGARPSMVNALASVGEDNPHYLPLVLYSEKTTTEAIIVDHRHTDVSKIPSEWITEARKLVVHYAHTSHGNQVLAGLNWLEGRNATYNVDIEAPDTLTLPDDTTALRIYDGNNYGGDNYIYPSMYWETEDGRTHTSQVVSTGWFDFSLWTWCGQMSDASTDVQLYIDTMADFETGHPPMRFIYYTGHTDGTGPGGTLWTHNNMVRNYVEENGMVLFDFADIETYTPAGGGPYNNDGEGDCEWCANWCTAHSTSFDCQSLPSCDHTHGLACTLKGQAFWWLMARLAGWDGTPAQ